jgi:uncharacterized OsmC-like protein
MPVQGINTRQLEAFNKEYEQSPSSFTLGLEARSIWEGRGLGHLGKVGRWSLGGQTMESPTRDFSVQIGSWKEVGDAVGVDGSHDRLEPVELALTGLASCVTEAIVLNCARRGVDLEAVEAKARLDVDPGPITGVKDPSDWDSSMKPVEVEVVARGDFSDEDKKVIEEGATRSPVHHMFTSGGRARVSFRYER